jgi:hypothetical protein
MKLCKKCGREFDKYCHPCAAEYQRERYYRKSTPLIRVGKNKAFIPEFPRLPGESFITFCRRYNDCHPWRFEFPALAKLIECRNAEIVHEG